MTSPRAASPALVLLATLAACGAPAASSPDIAAPAGAAGDSAAAPAGEAAPAGDATPSPAEPRAAPSPGAARAPAAAPRRAPVPVGTSYPEGLSPLSVAEQEEMKSKCAALSRAVAAASRKRGEKRLAAEIAEDVLTHPPALPGVDVPRCADLMLRDLRVYTARSLESEAVIGLKRIMFGMASAMDREPPALCPSAPPVPADLATLARGPYTSTQADWSPPGWACVGFQIIGPPQHYQFELKVDAKAQTFEAIARGYPVRGGPVSELFLAGKVEAGKINPSSDVKRR